MANRTEEREQFLRDILCCFVEDYGSNTWRQIQDRVMIEGEYVSCVFVDTAAVYELDEKVADSTHTVTIEVIARGINKVIDKNFSMNTQMQNNMRLANKENDAGYIDAYDADMIVQVGLWGEAVYG